jgi:alpha-D-xyloside xylohydrolase
MPRVWVCQVRVFGAGEDSTFNLYEDDGTSRAHETSGSFTVIPFSYDASAGTFTAGARQGGFEGMLATRTFKVLHFHSYGLVFGLKA